MITSLNVNQFLKKECWLELQGNRVLKRQIWEDVKDYYFNYIIDHIKTDDDVVILHEVPYIKEEPYIYKIDVRYKRGEALSEIYVELEAFCCDNGLDIVTPSTEETSFFRTIAIFMKGKYRKASIDINTIFKQYATRIVAIEKNTDIVNEIIVGVHIPKECKEYWDYLIKMHKMVTGNIRIIYLGDLNTYIPGTVNKNMLYKLLSEGVIDLWLEKGYSHIRETFDAHTRVDYVLMTGKDYDSRMYEVAVDDVVRKKGYTDHSAIILMK